MKLGDIHPNPKNPRFLRKEKSEWLEDSLAEFGDLSGYVFNKGGMIISAHQRWEKIKGKVKEIVVRETFKKPLPDGTIERGHFELTDGTKHDYSVRDWTPEKADRATIRANAQNAGEWDADVLANQWEFEPEELQEMGVPEWVFGEGSNALNSEKLEVQEDDYEIPDEIKTDIVVGDLFEIGAHRLICGDSTDSETVARLMGGEKADMVFTDPPYGVDYVGGTKDALVVLNDGRDGLKDLLTGSLTNAFAFSKNGACWYVAAPAGPQFYDFATVLKSLGVWRQTISWVKQSLVLGHSDYHYQHEVIFYGWKPGDSHKPPPDRKQTTVWHFDRPTSSREHPTMKPIGLVANAVENSSVPNWLITDPFGGSGTTMIAAHQLNRRCYMMELSEKYCQVIIDRMLKLDPTLEIKRNGQPYVRKA